MGTAMTSTIATTMTATTTIMITATGMDTVTVTTAMPDRDRDIRDWYRAHYDRLPPGLAKRDHLPPGLERQLVVDGTLPPGLQKKVQPCPRELEMMLPPPPPNYVHVVIGGNLVMYNRATLQIGDILRLDAAF